MKCADTLLPIDLTAESNNSFEAQCFFYPFPQHAAGLSTKKETKKKQYSSHITCLAGLSFHSGRGKNDGHKSEANIWNKSDNFGCIWLVLLAVCRKWHFGNANAQHVSTNKLYFWGGRCTQTVQSKGNQNTARLAGQSVNEDLWDSAASCCAEIQADEVKMLTSGENRQAYRDSKCFILTLTNV